MKQTLIIPGRLPGLNEYIDAERNNKYKAAKMKRDSEDIVMFNARRCRLKAFHGAVVMKYRFYEKDRRRDKDNISSYGRKIIQDALVKSKIIRNDGWNDIAGYSDTFEVDKKNPRIEIDIEEVTS